jgi:hypothetical protein
MEMFLDINLHLKDVHLGYQENLSIYDTAINYFNRKGKEVGFRIVVHNLSIGHKYFMDEQAYNIFSNECLKQLFIQLPPFEDIVEAGFSSVEHGVLIAPFYFSSHPFFFYKREQFDFLTTSKN